MIRAARKGMAISLFIHSITSFGDVLSIGRRQEVFKGMSYRAFVRIFNCLEKEINATLRISS